MGQQEYKVGDRIIVISGDYEIIGRKAKIVGFHDNNSKDSMQIEFESNGTLGHSGNNELCDGDYNTIIVGYGKHNRWNLSSKNIKLDSEFIKDGLSIDNISLELITQGIARI